MTYRKYLNEYTFEQVWRRIRAIYKEALELKPLYRRLYKSVKALPEYETTEKMTVAYDSRGDVQVHNCLDTQEELVDREVETYIIEWEEGPIPEADVPAHLLWWSSMYGFRTAGQNEPGLVEWLDKESGEFRESTIGEIAFTAISDTEVREKISDELIERSLADKRLRYWRSLIDHGPGGYSNFDLDIIRFQIEYKIGLCKYHRYDGWEENVRHMQTACVLLDLAAEHYRELDGRYVNYRNASRFGESISSDDDDEERDFSLRRLRCVKAKKLVWRYIDRYINDWWD